MVAFPRFSRTASTAAILLVGIAAVTALSGCSNPVKPPQTSTATATQTAGATSTAKPTPTPSDPPTPVTLSCEQVVTPQQLYDFNPNYGTDPGYTPAATSKAAAVVADKGVACGFLNQTSKSVIEVAIAKPSASELNTLKNAAVSTSQVVPTYGIPPTVEGYFTVANGVGQAQIFTNGYWIVLDSKDFAEPGDPQPLVASVLQNLPQG